MNKIYALLLVCVMLGCSHRKENPMHSYGFETIKELKFHSINLDDYIFKPTAIEVFDSLLLVYDPVENVNYTIFNINTLKPIFSGGNIGEGPDDILYGQFIDKINDKEFQVADLSNRKVMVYNIDSILFRQSFIPVKKISFADFSGKTDGNVEIMYYVNDSLNVSIGPFNSGKLAFLGPSNVEYKGSYPKDLAIDSHPFYFYQGVMQINHEKNLVLYHSPVGYYYDLYSMDKNEGNLVFSEYKPVEHVNDVTTNNTFLGISSADFAGDEIFLLFSGRTRKEFSDDAFLANNILVLDDSGNKQESYVTDRDNFWISVDNHKKIIYAIAKNPESYENEIGYYIYE